MQTTPNLNLKKPDATDTVSPEPFNDNADILDDIMLRIYPVGSIYLSVVDTNPSALFGGTWAAWGSGRVPVGVDTGNTYFNTVEKTGGHQNMQAHTHSVLYNGSANRGIDRKIYGDHGSEGSTRFNFMIASTAQGAGNLYASEKNAGAPLTTDTVGTGDSNNLQPYITCYMWKRTA